MKRLGLAVLISFCCIFAYVFGAALLVLFVFPDSEHAAHVLEIPLSLPAPLLDYLNPSLNEDIFYPVMILLDIVIYTVPIYGVMTLIARRKRSKTVKHSDPPPPPSFDS